MTSATVRGGIGHHKISPAVAGLARAKWMAAIRVLTGIERAIGDGIEITLAGMHQAGRAPALDPVRARRAHHAGRYRRCGGGSSSQPATRIDARWLAALEQGLPRDDRS